ncbi:virB8 family protein [Legionella longbeachae]|uniref:virB8 family protein n=1 Tax=Legionella longbeachae TaxID=450 RepID=UPI0001BEBC92|nr:type IV secretion system protein [Legionella longbeachae]EEZ95948.1 Legionella vir-like protein LvhB8 [Legionella longbeachae D-4968]
MSSNNTYFKEAKRWADDNFARIEISRNRYQIAFLLAMGLNIFAVIAVMVLANLQTLVPLMVHHYDNGITTVEPIRQSSAPMNKAQVESDIVRYMSNRESFDVSSYRMQFDLVSLLSNSTVNSEYLREQDKSAKEAPINILGAKAARSIHVYSINFLDNLIFNEKDFPKNHQNIAEVVFTLTDTDKASGRQTEEHYNALISWRYIEPSNNPDVRWKNWDGFQVTRYSKQLRNSER